MPTSVPLSTHVGVNQRFPNTPLAQIVGAISFALDLTEGQPPGHALRSTWIGMHVGRTLGLDDDNLADLYYAILLKDAGCSSNAARLWELYGEDDRLIKKDFKTIDSQNVLQLARFIFQHTGTNEHLLDKMHRILNLSRQGEALATELIQTRCERGADIARQLGFSEAVSTGIQYLDEHWNGKGHPIGLKQTAIPLFSRIALLAQVIDVFHQTGSRHAAMHEIRQRSGHWFDPELVTIVQQFSNDEAFWQGLASDGLESRVSALCPDANHVLIDETRLDHIAEVFASIVDIKSPYTHDHSRRVSQYADGIAEEMQLSDQHRRWLRRGALLHDVGKLGVSNHILDKPGKLDEGEWEAVRRHATFTTEILQRIFHFQEMAVIAGAHHERLDGKGYPLQLQDEQITLETRIITTADIFDAITAARPYRGPIPIPQAIDIMQKEVGTALDERCMAALCKRLPSWNLS